MCKKMTEVAEANNMLGQAQFGFRKGRSTLDAAFVLSALFQKAKKKGWHYSTAFVDISKVIYYID